MKLDRARQLFQARRRSWMALILLLLLNISLAVYAAMIQEPRIAALQGELAGHRERAGVERQVATRTERYNKALADLGTVQERIYPKRDFARYLSELFDTAKKDRVSINSITYKPAMVGDGHLLDYGIGMAVSGKYGAIKQFIRDLADAQNLTVVEKIALSSGAASDEQVQLQVQLSAYFRMEGQ